eukprot:TRINITY_DN7622_c0_g1_i1.p1 TRINITY_DN7622_c0_g1~~TRINITY_DN7622_c0_g1_i1.p1  ORF type:complete len:1023 (+),score=287.81 TRINITY_DN7622_c0_g1_i1:64-3132(+)
MLPSHRVPDDTLPTSGVTQHAGDRCGSPVPALPLACKLPLTARTGTAPAGARRGRRAPQRSKQGADPQTGGAKEEKQALPQVLPAPPSVSGAAPLPPPGWPLDVRPQTSNADGKRRYFVRSVPAPPVALTHAPRPPPDPQPQLAPADKQDGARHQAAVARAAAQQRHRDQQARRQQAKNRRRSVLHLSAHRQKQTESAPLHIDDGLQGSDGALVPVPPPGFGRSELMGLHGALVTSDDPLTRMRASAAPRSLHEAELESAMMTGREQAAKEMVSQLVTVKQENLELLARLIEAEEWRGDLRSKISSDLAVQKREVSDLKELVSKEKEEVVQLRGQLKEEKDVTLGLTEELRKCQQSLREAQTGFDSRRELAIGLTAARRLEDRSYLESQSLVIQQAQETLSGTKMLNTSLKRQVEALRSDKWVLQKEMQMLQDKLASAKLLLSQRVRHTEAEKRLAEEDASGVPAMLSSSGELTSVERMRYTPRPLWPLSLSDRHGVNWKHKPTATVVTEVLSLLDQKAAQGRSMEDELVTSRKELESLRALDNFTITAGDDQPPRDTRIGEGGGRPRIPCLVSGPAIPRFLRTEHKSVHALGWTRLAAARHCLAALDAVVSTSGGWRQSLGDATDAALVAGFVSILVLAACREDRPQPPGARRRPSRSANPTRRRRPQPQQAAPENDKSKWAGDNTFTELLRLWLRDRFEEDGLRARHAYNLLHYAEENVHWEPCCKMLVLCCSAAIPITCFRDTNHVVRQASDAFLRMDTEGTQTLERTQLSSALQLLFTGKPEGDSLMAKCALARDCDDRLMGDVPYEALVRNESSTAGASVLVRFLRDYALKEHMFLYGEIERALRGCARGSTLVHDLDLVPLSQAQTVLAKIALPGRSCVSPPIGEVQDTYVSGGTFDAGPFLDRCSMGLARYDADQHFLHLGGVESMEPRSPSSPASPGAMSSKGSAAALLGASTPAAKRKPPRLAASGTESVSPLKAEWVSLADLIGRVRQTSLRITDALHCAHLRKVPEAPLEL